MGWWEKPKYCKSHSLDGYGLICGLCPGEQTVEGLINRSVDDKWDAMIRSRAYFPRYMNFHFLYFHKEVVEEFVIEERFRALRNS